MGALPAGLMRDETALPPAQAGGSSVGAAPPARERDSSAALRRHLFMVTAGLSSALIGYMFWASSRPDSSLVVLVFLTGGFGGMLSAYRRFRLISPGPPTDQAPPHALPMDAYLSPLLGAMFGVILYLVMMTGIIQGDFFPRFRGLDQPYSGLFSVFNGAGPAEVKDAVKTVFWAFLAGFSERFVPDLLGRVGPRR